jgi:hypothetical protein
MPESTLSLVSVGVRIPALNRSRRHLDFTNILQAANYFIRGSAVS